MPTPVVRSTFTSFNFFETSEETSTHVGLVEYILEPDSTRSLGSRHSHRKMRLGGKLIDQRTTHSQSASLRDLPRLIAETSPTHNFTSSSQAPSAGGMVGFRDIPGARVLSICVTRPGNASRTSLARVSEGQFARHLWRIEVSVSPPSEPFTAVRLLDFDGGKLDSTV